MKWSKRYWLMKRCHEPMDIIPKAGERWVEYLAWGLLSIRMLAKGALRRTKNSCSSPEVSDESVSPLQ